MTDREILNEMFKRQKIEVSEEKGNIIIDGGYIGFYTVFEFNSDDTLRSVEAYE